MILLDASLDLTQGNQLFQLMIVVARNMMLS